MLCSTLWPLFLAFWPMAVPNHPPWPTEGAGESLRHQFEPPPGFTRLSQTPESFGVWLANLPMLPKDRQVRLFDGRLKSNQQAHCAVLDIDVGTRDLQQCADAVMRLRAEYLWSSNQKHAITFNFTSGHTAKWSEWERGMRPTITGSQVRWQIKGLPDSSYKNFRRYLNIVFSYAGSASLAKELQRVRDPQTLLPGDVFLQGGFPGHAVMVMDVAENAAGERVFLLAQSYMPAQQIHILKQPGSSSPWYPAQKDGTLNTPEWRFSYSDLYRFPSPTDSP